MNRLKRLFYAWVLVFNLLALPGGQAQAADEGPGRQAEILVPFTRYEWWLIRWADNVPVCQVFVDHEDWPTAKEIYANCTDAVYSQWLETTPCPGLTDGASDTSTCPGLYLFLVSSEPAEKTIVVDLPPAQVWVTLSGCLPSLPENFCPDLPSLLLTGEEPLPNERITAIHALLDGQAYECQASTCDIPLQPTLLGGVTVEFWADSSYGDSSAHFMAQVRVIDSGVTETPAGGGWYVDVLSSQWRGAALASCAQVWQAFPPVGGPPAWLSTPEAPELMSTDQPYYYLAGRLIAQGLVDASGCDTGGLLANGYADACGLEAAMPLVQDWQNRFDAKIVEVAKETGVPAQLMKNLFAQESQFWPGAFKDPKEFGLGQLTENGAETVLLWNPDFYAQFCPLVLDASACQVGYVHLDPEKQAILRGALALEAKSDCAECPAGIDLTNADFSINLFAQTLLANCEQVAQIMYNGTQKIAGAVSSYEDLWRLTVANYHAGAGCISYGVYNAWTRNEAMTWTNISNYLTPPCQGVISYVEKIAR
jgi:hypothetical protein